MYYNRILRIWVIDGLDYFLISFIIGTLLASYFKDYLSEKAAMERLKRSIINKSKTNRPILNSNRKKIQKIYRFALNKRGGQTTLPPIEDYLFENEVFKLAQQIKGMVERLAAFLKERELKGVAKIFFKNGRFMLELLLYKCKIDITYSPLTEGLNAQVIVITATAGGAAGFTLSWFSVGASLVSVPLLVSALLLRSVTQQVLNQREYSNFKKMIDNMLNDDELKKTLRTFFVEGEGQTPRSGGLEMKAVDFNKNFALKYDFESKSDEGLEEFIKARMKEKLGLIENPTETQLKEIIHRKVNRKPKGKTVLFRDFINKISSEGFDVSDSDIIDIEILKKSIKIKEE